MPFYGDPTEIVAQGERVLLRSNQIILWVSLSRPGVIVGDSSAMAFPAILDTGHTHSFSIHERHLTEWGGIRSESLRDGGRSGKKVIE